MERPELIPPGQEVDVCAPAPGDLELVRSFLSLHDHTYSSPESLAPSPESLGWWLRTNGKLAEGEAAQAKDLAFAAGVLEALRARIGSHPSSEAGASSRELDRAAAAAGLRIRWDDDVRLRPTATGIRGALGRILAIAFLAELDGSWQHLRDCGNPTCRSVFYDRSKNHSGKWCSMQSCGNRAKVRAFRERRAAAT